MHVNEHISYKFEQVLIVIILSVIIKVLKIKTKPLLAQKMILLGIFRSNNFEINT